MNKFIFYSPQPIAFQPCFFVLFIRTFNRPSLKAFLKAQGFTIEKLKNKYGHDLEWEWS